MGKELITEIVKNIDKDQIHLPVFEKIRYSSNFNYHLDDFIKYFETLDPGKLSTHQVQSINNDTRLKNGNLILTELKQIENLSKLRQALIDFDPVSIDSFLRDHPSYAEAGKIMIIYSLLKCEYKEKFHLKNAIGDDNWYSFLIHDILSGWNNPEDILKNKLSIITFNYSVDLDYCLRNKLENVEILKNGIGDKFIQQLKIEHVYGQLYADNIEETYGSFSKNPNDQFLNTKRFSKSVKSRNEIKLIGHEREENPACKKSIEKAKEIIVIGFGFDRDNLNILGFPSQLERYSAYFKGKKFKYMDFKGKMKSLHDQFSAIPLQDGCTITRSPAEKITDAYQNDFKIYLY